MTSPATLRAQALANVTLPAGVIFPAGVAAMVAFSVLPPVQSTSFFGGYAEDDMLADMGVAPAAADATESKKA